MYIYVYMYIYIHIRDLVQRPTAVVSVARADLRLKSSWCTHMFCGALLLELHDQRPRPHVPVVPTTERILSPTSTPHLCTVVSSGEPVRRGYKDLKARYSILDTRHLILDTRHLTLDTWYLILDTWNLILILILNTCTYTLKHLYTYTGTLKWPSTAVWPTRGPADICIYIYIYMHIYIYLYIVQKARKKKIIYIYIY